MITTSRSAQNHFVVLRRMKPAILYTLFLFILYRFLFIFEKIVRE